MFVFDNFFCGKKLFNELDRRESNLFRFLPHIPLPQSKDIPKFFRTNKT